MKTNLYTVGQWYKNRGLVGETDLALVQTVVAVSGKNMGFGLEAPSGSGKSATMDLLVGRGDGNDTALIKSKFVYFKDAGSTTSFFYDAEKINAAKIIVFFELQKDKSDMTVEAIKSMTEGKSASRKVTNMAKEEVTLQEIKPKTVMYTLAIENDTKPDAELRRRCITMSTDVSKEQTAKVLEIKSKMRWDPQSIQILDEQDSNDIRENVNAILLNNTRVVNPFTEMFAKIVAEIAPDQKVRSMMEHFWDVMEGVVKINSLERVQLLDKKTGSMVAIANIQDLYQTLDIYKSSFLRDVYSIPPLGDIILKGFDDAFEVKETEKDSKSDLAGYGFVSTSTKWVDVNHLRKAIKERQKVVLAKNVVIQICRQLVDAGYLEDAKIDNVVKYQVQEKFTEFNSPEPEKLVAHAYELVKNKYPEKADKWHEQQFQPYIHPISGKEISLLEQKSILDEIDDGDM